MWKGIQPFSSSASYIPTLDKQITHHLHYIQVEATQIEQTQVEDRTAKLLWLFSTYGTSWKLLMRFHFSPWTSSCTWEEIEKNSRTFCKEWAAFLNFRGMQHQNIWIFGQNRSNQIVLWMTSRFHVNIFYYTMTQWLASPTLDTWSLGSACQSCHIHLSVAYLGNMLLQRHCLPMAKASSLRRLARHPYHLGSVHGKIAEEQYTLFIRFQLCMGGYISIHHTLVHYLESICAWLLIGLYLY